MQITLNSAFWQLEGRTFHQIGTYLKNEWNLRDDVFPNRKFGFNSRRLKIVTNFVSNHITTNVQLHETFKQVVKHPHNIKERQL